MIVDNKQSYPHQELADPAYCLHYLSETFLEYLNLTYAFIQSGGVSRKKKYRLNRCLTGTSRRRRTNLDKRLSKYAKSIRSRRIGSGLSQPPSSQSGLISMSQTSRPSFANLKKLCRGFTLSCAQMLASRYPVLDRFTKDSAYLFSIKTGLAVDPLIDQKYIRWMYVDRSFTKASIVLEGNSWDATGQLMIWTELPDDQFGGMTVDVFICNHVAGRWTLTLQMKNSVSDLSERAKSAFESFLDATF